MQFEDFDKKIKLAAEQYHPPYDETAWKKMRKLLDSNLPQNRNNRWKLIFLLFIVILTTGSAYFMIEQQWKKTSKNVPNDVSLNSSETKKKSAIETTNSNREAISSPDKSDYNLQSTETEQQKEKSILINTGNQKRQTHNTFTPLDKFLRSPDRIQTESSITLNEEMHNELLHKNAELITNEGVTEKTNLTKLNIENQLLLKTLLQNSSGNKLKINLKKQGKFVSNFAITLSAGPDISGVNGSELGKTTMLYGAGVSYNLSKYFTLRSGFYVSNKIYSAKPSDYYPPKTYWTNYVDLKKVEADCDVYEIPLNLLYNFSHGKNHNIFISAGLSSYLMKRETYNYHYFDTTGQYGYSSHTLKNKYKHFLSVLSLSGGYEQKINRNFSIIAEPYIKIPVNGVGFGRVKLNSGGILFTVSVKPFISRK